MRIRLLRILILLNLVLLGILLIVPGGLLSVRDESAGIVFDRSVLSGEIRAALLAHGIRENHIRERKHQPGDRVEITALYPRPTATTVINFDVHHIARKLQCRSGAREDSRSGSVTIFISRDNRVILTVVLRRAPEN